MLDILDQYGHKIIVSFNEKSIYRLLDNFNSDRNLHIYRPTQAAKSGVFSKKGEVVQIVCPDQALK